MAVYADVLGVNFAFIFKVKMCKVDEFLCVCTSRFIFRQKPQMKVWKLMSRLDHWEQWTVDIVQPAFSKAQGVH